MVPEPRPAAFFDVDRTLVGPASMEKLFASFLIRQRFLTAADLARYLSFLMGSPPDGVDGEAVLAHASLEEMWRTVVPIGDSPIGEESMGLSFFLYDDGGRKLVGHTGTQKAFYSFFILDPQAKVAAIAAFNSVGAAGGAPRTDQLRVDTRTLVVRTVFPLYGSGG